jgi:hypothetical protein
LTKAFPRLLGEVRDVVGARRIVFDRGGCGPKLFNTIIKDGFDVIRLNSQAAARIDHHGVRRSRPRQR